MFYRRCTGNGGDAAWKAAENSEELTARVSLRPWIYLQDSRSPQRTS